MGCLTDFAIVLYPGGYALTGLDIRLYRNDDSRCHAPHLAHDQLGGPPPGRRRPISMVQRLSPRILPGTTRSRRPNLSGSTRPNNTGSSCKAQESFAHKPPARTTRTARRWTGQASGTVSTAGVTRAPAPFQYIRRIPPPSRSAPRACASTQPPPHAHGHRAERVPRAGSADGGPQRPGRRQRRHEIATAAAYAWQRFAGDGTTLDDANIGTGPTYTLTDTDTDTDAGKRLKVTVTFTDDGGYAEGPFTTAATAAVTAAAECAEPTYFGGAT